MHLLTALLDDGLTPAGVLMPGWDRAAEQAGNLFPVQPPSEHTWTEQLEERGLSVRRVAPGRLNEIPALADTWQADMLVSACFPYRLENETLSGCPQPTYNVHTSLLPRYRGPAPLFWQFYAGEQQTGFTVHRMIDELDAGPVVAQVSTPLEIGVSGATVEHRLAGACADLFRERLPTLRTGKMPDVVQDESAATWAPWPKPKDFCLDSTWTVERAYRFLCGTHDWGQAYVFTERDGGQIPLRGPATQETAGGEPEYGKGVIELECADGVLLARGVELV